MESRIKTILSWIKQRSKICMKCNKSLRFWQRKYRLLRKDYLIWHWKCRPDSKKFKEVKIHKWWKKICCFFLGHWWADTPDGSGDLFCERGCGK